MKFQAFKEITILLLLSVLLGLITTYATHQGLFFSTTDKKTGKEQDNLQMISLEQAKELFYSKTALFIDARREFDYKLGHIVRAVNIPLDEIDKNPLLLRDIPKDNQVVVYCNGDQCSSSLELAAKLSEAGFTAIRIFYGGWQEWTAAHLPITK